MNSIDLALAGILQLVGALAKKLGFRRIWLHVGTSGKYLSRNRAMRVTDRLNSLYSGVDSSLPAGLVKAQSSSLEGEEW